LRHTVGRAPRRGGRDQKLENSGQIILDNGLSISAHSKWECKYHVVWIPKYRRKALYGELRKHIGPVLRELARQRECVVEEGHLQLAHVHMLLSIPPK
jgi:putative transposase